MKDINDKYIATMTVKGSGAIYFEKNDNSVEYGRSPITLVEFKELFPIAYKIEFDC